MPFTQSESMYVSRRAIAIFIATACCMSFMCRVAPTALAHVRIASHTQAGNEAGVDEVLSFGSYVGEDFKAHSELRTRSGGNLDIATNALHLAPAGGSVTLGSGKSQSLVGELVHVL